MDVGCCGLKSYKFAEAPGCVEDVESASSSLAAEQYRRSGVANIYFNESSGNSYNMMGNPMYDEVTGNLDTSSFHSTFWHIKTSTTNNTHLQWHILPPSSKFQPCRHRCESSTFQKPKLRTSVHFPDARVLVHYRPLEFWEDDAPSNTKWSAPINPSNSTVLPLPRIR